MKTETSKSSRLRVAWLWQQRAGALGLTYAPGKHATSRYEGVRWERDLDIDLQTLVDEHVGVLVCLMERHELDEVQIPALFERARARGIEVVHFPIVDGEIPSDLHDVHNLLANIQSHLDAGTNVVVHCLGGLGRTGTIGGCFLMREGVPFAVVREKLVTARGPRCPENSHQLAYIERYVAPPMEPALPPRELLPQPRIVERPWYARAIAGERITLDELPELRRARTRGDVRRMLEEAERGVSAAPERCFRFDDGGGATLNVAGGSYAAGRFETPTVAELRERVAKRAGAGSGHVRLTVIQGTHPATDIGALQAVAEPGTLFQVASQFNCLEAPGPRVTSIESYLADPTQGPRASVSAFPGVFLRHYAAPGARGDRFIQSDARCLNLLADVFGDEVATVRSGYLRSQDVRDPNALSDALRLRFEQIRIGVHDDVEVVLGHDWAGPVRHGQRIAQTLTSTMALGAYSRASGDGEWERNCSRTLLRAAFLGTLFAAMDLEKNTLVLTLIGGGVFGAPHDEIWAAIGWAIDQAEPLVGGRLDVFVNAREAVHPTARAILQARGGVVLEVGRGGVRRLEP